MAKPFHFRQTYLKRSNFADLASLKDKWQPCIQHIHFLSISQRSWRYVTSRSEDWDIFWHLWMAFTRWISQPFLFRNIWDTFFMRERNETGISPIIGIVISSSIIILMKTLGKKSRKKQKEKINFQKTK